MCVSSQIHRWISCRRGSVGFDRIEIGHQHRRYHGECWHLHPWTMIWHLLAQQSVWRQRRTRHIWRLHQMSSSIELAMVHFIGIPYDVGQYREGKRRDRIQWWRPNRARKRQGSCPRGYRWGGRVWANRTYRSTILGRQWYQWLRDRNHDRDHEYHQMRGSSCRHQSNRWIDVRHLVLEISTRVRNLSLRILRHWPIEYGHNPGSRQTKDCWLRQHHRRPNYQRTMANNHPDPS